MSIPNPRSAEDAPTLPPHRAERLDLLLIEDCAADVRLLELHLEPAIRRGEVTLTCVDRLTDATRLLARRSFACVLLDLDLPDARGVATVERLRIGDPDVAVVVITGADSDDIAEQTLRLGVQDYLVKGRHDAGLLLRRLRFAVQHHRALARSRAVGCEAFVVATTDPVTGLANHWLFEDRLDHALAQAARTGAGVGLLVIGYEVLARDRDEALTIDDPALLRRIAEALDDGLRKSDTLATLADDLHGVVLVPNDAAFDALTVARRFDALLRELALPGIRLVPHVGVATFPEDGDTAVDLRERAEQAMHRARRQGGGVRRYRHPAAVPAADHPAPRERGDCARIELLFQPWYDLRDERPLGIEALPVGQGSAWRTTASDATETGRAEWQVLSAALHQFAAFRAAGLAIPVLGLRCTANLLRESTFADRLDLVRQGLTIDAGDLRLLIDTELLISATPAQTEWLRQLRDRGYRVVLDRFLDSADGVGVLAMLPIDALRIGANAIAALPAERVASPARRSIAAAVGAAAGLSLEVLANGVDDELHRDQLRALGLRYGQGDALCPAVTAAELPAVWPAAVAPHA